MNSSFYRLTIVFPDESIVPFLHGTVYQLRPEIRQRTLTFALKVVALAINSRISDRAYKVFPNTLYHVYYEKTIQKVPAIAGTQLYQKILILGKY